MRQGLIGRRQFLAVGGLGVVAALAGCSNSGSGPTGSSASAGSTPNSGQLEEVGVIEGSPASYRVPHYVAVAQGFYEDHGLAVSSVSTSGGTTSAQVLAAGRSQFAIGQLVDAINLQNAGVDVQGIAEISCRINNDVLIRSNGTGSIADILQQKSIGVSTLGSGSWQFIRWIALLADIDPDSLKIVAVGSSGPQSLESGQIDVLVFSGPQGLNLVQTGEAKYLVQSMDPTSGLTPGLPALGQALNTPQLFNWVYCTTDFLKSRPDTARNFAGALQDALDWINGHTAAELADLIVEAKTFEGIDASILEQSFQLMLAHGAVPKTTVINQTDYENSALFLKQADAKTYTTTPSFDELANNSFNS